MPILHVVAGPNGCGKSTLTRMNGFGGIDVIDPDEIARGMVSGSPRQAARGALHRRRDALNSGRTHLVETTLVSPAPAFFATWKLRGERAIGSFCTMCLSFHLRRP